MGKREKTVRTVCAIIALVCAVSAAEYRTYDGRYNNKYHEDWGGTDTQLMRKGGAAYEDGVSEPAGAYRCSSRVISDMVCAQKEPIYNPYGLSDYLWAWGQFVDHDITLTEPQEGEYAEAFDIMVPPGDPQFDPYYKGGITLPLTRSVYDTATGTDTSNPRQQINEITAWLDGSNVYGSDAARAAWLRTGYKGLLKSQYHPLYGELLPYEPGTTMFAAGDIRVNENIALTCMHTLLMREHNRLAYKIWQEHPTWTDEEIYQKARKVVGAEIQVVTYKEFLPALLGEYLPEYKAYNHNVDPSIATEFSTAAYRIGHTLLSPVLLRLDKYWKEVPCGNVPLSEAFMNPTLITEEGGIEPFLRGLVSQESQKIDVYVVDGVRNVLFGNQDLASLNLQRGRDHGLLDYNSMREAWGLTPVTDWTELTYDTRVQWAMKCAYGNVYNMDPWLGMLAEQNNARVGHLMAKIIKDQFIRMRDGDRFWYQNDPELAEYLPWLEKVRLSDLIMQNTSIKDMPEEVFYTTGKPKADEMTIWAAYVVKGYAPGCDTVMVYGNSMDATHENMLQCEKVKVWIRVDEEPWPVMYEEIPVSAGTYKYGKFTYRSTNSSHVAYLQCDLVKKTFCLMAKKVDMSKMKEKMAVDMEIDGYYGCGETTTCIVR